MSDEGFLQRWSRRKQAVRDRRPSPEASRPMADDAAQETPAAAEPDAPPQTAGAGPGESWPTLAQAQQLTPQSDFRPFLARGVAPEVRNAAMRKLFADPRFNVMDGLDATTEDFSHAAPLPAAVTQRLASARFLGLGEPEPPPREDALAPLTGTVAECPTDEPVKQPGAAVTDAAGPVDADRTVEERHANSDLQLQPDDPARREGPGPVAR